MEQTGFEQILRQMARAANTTPEKIRQEMESAMASALQNPDPVVQQMWDSIPRKGDTPTLDEFMEYLIQQNTLLP